jgi:6-pyruvoyltetrahydropterin/6-carboxytetrahydropterin synthase
MAIVHITRRERFSAAHKLFREDWSDEKNSAVFGGCSNPNWHGHNYELWVTVKGEPREETGYVVDLKMLSDIIKTKVIDKLDHRNVNLDVDFMKGKMASTEIIAVAIWNELKADVQAEGCEMHSIKLSETENNFVEYFGA